jgi:hypothetical protein
LDLKSVGALSLVAESFGVAASSISAAFDPDAAIWALGAADVAAGCGAGISDVDELGPSVVAPADASALGAAAVADALVSSDRAS